METAASGKERSRGSVGLQIPIKLTDDGLVALAEGRRLSNGAWSPT